MARNEKGDAFRWFEERLRFPTPFGQRHLESLRETRRAAIASGMATPPVRLELLIELAKKLGVKQITRTPLTVNGRIIQEGQTPTIELSDQLEPFRLRFTLAHELAHLVIGERDKAVSYGKWEAICDDCAAELLIPADFLRERLDPLAPSLRAVSEAADVAECPPDFVLGRVVSLGLAAFLDTWWCRAHVDGRIAVIKSVPARDDRGLDQLELLCDGTDPISLALAETRPESGRLEIREWEVKRTVSVEVLPLGERDALAVIMR